MNQRCAPRSPFVPAALLWVASLALSACAPVKQHVGITPLPGAVASEVMDADANDSFFKGFTAPLWVVLILNIGMFVAAGAGAIAALRTNPKTAKDVAETQAAVARSAVDVAASSAEAAGEAARASTINARAASRSAENQGLHAVARLRQKWINELRSRIAQVHALLVNFRALDPAILELEDRRDYQRRQRDANEALARIELMLNPDETPSKRLLKAIRDLEASNSVDVERAKLGAIVIERGQKLLKAEWDRLRGELVVGMSPSSPSDDPTVDENNRDIAAV